MYRNLLNRWWTFTLACVVGLVLLASTAMTSHAGGFHRPIGGFDPVPVPAPDPNPVGSGDPDTPQGSGRTSPQPSHGNTMGGLRQGASAPGEISSPSDVWVLRIRLALQMVRVFYLRD
jgi:hypothetical protein